MDNRRRNNYNPYTFGYQAPLESASISYNPVYDPAETQRMTELLQQRQQRYDVGREALSEFEGQVGGMQTYAPDALNQRLESFNQKALDLVNNQYGRDYGLAYNDLKGLISKEKSDPFYKFNAEQVRQAEEFEKARLQKRAGNERFLAVNDPRKVNLEEAMASKDFTKLQADYLIAPDYDEAATELIKNVPANASEFYTSLSTSEKALFGETGYDVGAFIAKTSESGNASKLAGLSDELTKSLYGKYKQQFEYEGKLAGKTGEQYAKEFVDNKIEQLKYSKTGRDISFQGDKTPSTSKNTDEYGFPLTRPMDNVVSNKNQEHVNKTYGESGVNLDKPIEPPIPYINCSVFCGE